MIFRKLHALNGGFNRRWSREMSAARIVEDLNMFLWVVGLGDYRSHVQAWVIGDPSKLKHNFIHYQGKAPEQ